MFPVVKEEHSTRPLLHQERHQWCVGLGRVAVAAGEDEIVRTVVSRLTPAGPDMVQCDGVLRGLDTAIGAYGPVLDEEPVAVGLHGTAG